MHPGSFNPGLEVYNPRVRPNQGQGPVKVTANMYLRAVEDIDAEKNASILQGSTNRQAPGCVNAAGKLRQKW